MLNNDFDILVKKYNQYEQGKKKKRNRRIVFFIMIVALASYIMTRYLSTPSKQDDSNTTKATLPTLKNKDINKTVQEQTQKESQKESNESKPKHSDSNTHTIGLKATTEGETLSQLLAHQAHSQSYSSTIALANYFYSQKEYEKTIKWAIEASKKNKSKVRPWILYAKCKNAQGKKEIAKKALSLFLKRHQSNEVQELLHTLQ